jgi:hypothetical protein
MKFQKMKKNRFFFFSRGSVNNIMGLLALQFANDACILETVPSFLHLRNSRFQNKRHCSLYWHMLYYICPDSVRQFATDENETKMSKKKTSYCIYAGHRHVSDNKMFIDASAPKLSLVSPCCRCCKRPRRRFLFMASSVRSCPIDA